MQCLGEGQTTKAIVAALLCICNVLEAAFSDSFPRKIKQERESIFMLCQLVSSFIFDEQVIFFNL